MLPFYSSYIITFVTGFQEVHVARISGTSPGLARGKLADFLCLMITITRNITQKLKN